jgi:tetratricopeptide (TPR) repeat protein
VLREIDAAGKADGPLLYRLAYCERTAGDVAASEVTQERARKMLEAELPSARDLEIPFYLVNTYQNLGREADVQRVARETTGRVEGGSMPRPGSNVDMFRLGKLYADQNATGPAAEWYEKALDAGIEGASYVRWAGRYVAERSFESRDFARAAKHFTILTGAGEASGPDFDRLAVSRARIGEYEAAAEAWDKAEQMDPAEGNRARYCGKLAAMAAKLRNPPAQSRSGVRWSDVSQQDLEAILKAEAQAFRDLVGVIEGIDDPTQEEKEDMRRRINDVKGQFVMAGLEYGLRGHGLRETAFFGGYAPLILRHGAWRPRWKGDRKSAEPEAGS